MFYSKVDFWITVEWHGSFGAIWFAMKSKSSSHYHLSVYMTWCHLPNPWLALSTCTQKITSMRVQFDNAGVQLPIFLPGHSLILVTSCLTFSSSSPHELYMHTSSKAFQSTIAESTLYYPDSQTACSFQMLTKLPKLQSHSGGVCFASVANSSACGWLIDAFSPETSASIVYSTCLTYWGSADPAIWQIASKHILYVQTHCGFPSGTP